MGTSMLLIRRLFCKSVCKFAHTKCKVGDMASAVRRITADDVIAFAHLSGDTNPIHMPNANDSNISNEKHENDGRLIVHGALLNGLVSSLIGTQLPGPGTLVVSQSLNFPQKCYAGENVLTTVKVTQARKIIKLEFACLVVECNKCVLHGEAKVLHQQ